MTFEIVIDGPAKEELARFRKTDQTKIVSAIEKQLADQPETPTRNRKKLEAVEPGFEFEPPLWELRVGEYRVFYDVEAERHEVHVRAIRHKPPEKRTKDILK